MTDALSIYVFALPAIVLMMGAVGAGILIVHLDRGNGKPTPFDPLLDRLNAWWPSRPPRK